MTTMNNTNHTDRRTSPSKCKSKGNSRKIPKKRAHDDPYATKMTNSKRYQIELSNGQRQNYSKHQPYYDSNYKTINCIYDTNTQLRTCKSTKSLRQQRSNQDQHNIQKHSFDMKSIQKENQKEFFTFLSNDLSFNQNTLMESKTDLLIKMIISIKKNGFDKYHKELNDKIILNGVLKQSISNLHQNIVNAKAEQKCQHKVDNYLYKEIGALRVREMKPVNYEDYSELQKEIANRQIDVNKQQTKNINTEIIKSIKELTTMKESLKRLTKMVSDKEREKENFPPAIQLMKKHITTVKSKIQAQIRLSNNITHKMANVMIEKDF